MKGMELARGYYEECARDQIAATFPQYAGRIAVGLVGEGSECYGYDDSYSQDHDFGPGFCLWLDADTAKAIGRDLQRLYDQLPKEFRGYVWACSASVTSIRDTPTAQEHRRTT